jgi:hypothetical protein
MITWSFIIFVSIWFGFEFLDLILPSIIDPLALVAAGIPVGFTLTSWLFLLFRFISPLQPFHGFFLTILLFITCFFLHKFVPRPRRHTRVRGPEFFFILISTTILFFFLVDKSILKDSVNSSGTVFSDLPVHLGLITSFSYGSNSYRSQMMTPFYAGEKLSYPIIPDFFSAILVSCGGATLRMSIALPTMLLLVSLVILLHFFAGYFSSARFVPEFAIFCFFMAGGVGWRYLFVQQCRDNPNANMVHAFCDNIFTFWIHPLIHFLLPQRSALFSMPIVILITIGFCIQ